MNWETVVDRMLLLKPLVCTRQWKSTVHSNMKCAYIIYGKLRRYLLQGVDTATITLCSAENTPPSIYENAVCFLRK